MWRWSPPRYTPSSPLLIDFFPSCFPSLELSLIFPSLSFERELELVLSNKTSFHNTGCCDKILSNTMWEHLIGSPWSLPPPIFFPPPGVSVPFFPFFTQRLSHSWFLASQFFDLIFLPPLPTQKISQIPPSPNTFPRNGKPPWSLPVFSECFVDPLGSSARFLPFFWILSPTLCQPAPFSQGPFHLFGSQLWNLFPLVVNSTKAPTSFTCKTPPFLPGSTLYFHPPYPFPFCLAFWQRPTTTMHLAAEVFLTPEPIHFQDKESPLAMLGLLLFLVCSSPDPLSLSMETELRLWAWFLFSR